jgi:hypothetical protein
MTEQEPQVPEQRRLYKTSSIVLAATLVHEKMKLIGLEPIPKRSQDLFYFVFEDNDEEKRKDIVMNFSNNSILVCPTTFMELVRQLKQRTKEYSANRGEL